MTLKDANRAKGSIQDVTRLSALPDDDCHILFVSSRTLYLLANYAQNEVTYLGRYAKSFEDGGLYSAVEQGDTEEIAVLDFANKFSLEVVPVCQEIVAAIGDITAELNGIKVGIDELSVNLTFVRQSIDTTTQISGCCDPTGENAPPTAPDLEDPDIGDPPDDWATWELYWTYKCRAANRIADDWIATLNGLATLSGAAGAIGAIALGLFLNTSLLGGILVGLIAIGFSAAAAAAVVITALVAIVFGGVGLLAYFAQIGSEVAANKDDLVCQLFYSQSPANANQIVVDFTADIAADLTYDPADDDALFQAQAGIMVDALFNDALTNILFELDEDTDSYVGTVDCDDCTLAILLEQVLTDDTPRALYDTQPAAGCIDQTAYWEQTGAHNIYNGIGRTFEAPDPPFPASSTETLTFRVRFDMRTMTPGIVRLQSGQGSVVKQERTFVCKDGCETAFQSYEYVITDDYDTLYAGGDRVWVAVAGQNSGTRIRNIYCAWEENP